MNERFARGALLGLLLTYFALGMIHATHTSITFDEGPHLAVGYTTLRTGDLRLQPIHIHPPLANVLAAAPLLLQSDLPDPRTVDGWEIASLSAITDAVVWRYPEPARIAVAGRLPILWLGVLLGSLIYRWARDLGGRRAGLLALALYAFDPNCIAHGALITTDVAAVFFIVATLYLTSCELRIANYELRITHHASRITYSRSAARLVGIGVLLGLAQLTKVSAVMLVPVVGLLLVVRVVVEQNQRIENQRIENQRIENQRISESANGESANGQIKNHASLFPISQSLIPILVVFSVTAFVVWAGYGFEISAVPGLPFPLPAGTHIRIFQSLREHYELGHPTFLMGQVSSHGWWWYFPVAFVLKTPLPTLLLALGAVLRFALKCWNVGTLKRWNGQTVNVLALLFFPLLYAASSLFSSVNIGYRHLLPLLPFLYVGIGVQMANSEWRMANGKPRITNHASRITNYSLLLTWLIIGTLAITPHFLTFFNEFAGGARGGYRYLVDSNLDWGQNLWDLRRWMVERGVERVYYAHYTPARPDVYGIDAHFLPPDPRAVAFAPWHPAPGLYAIGATVLQGPYAPEINTYAWFRDRTPLARLGRALFIYEVEATPAPGWAVLCASDHPFSPEGVARRVGVDDLRVLWPDCTHTRVYPAGEQPGILIAPPDVAAPPMGEVDVRLRSADGKAEHLIYRLSGVAPAPGVLVSDVELDGPLDFLGYTLYADVVSPGSALVMETHWRVRAVPGRLLSLMAHLLAPDGAGVAVGDGLGFPIEQWRPGDVFVQRHTLVVPANTPSGTYTIVTGGYWLDTMERWGVGASEAYIVVEAIVVGD